MLRGTDRKDRKRPEIQASGNLISLEDLRKAQPFGYKSLSARGRRIYWTVAKQMAALEILDSAFLPEIMMFAYEYDVYLDCIDDIAENGRYIRLNGEHGETLAVNPSFQQKQKSLENVVRIGSNFGLSPVDRQKLRIDAENSGRKVKSIMQIFEYEDDEEDRPDAQ